MAWIKENKWCVTMFVMALLVAAMGVAAAGCQLQDLVSVKVPGDIREAVGVEGRVTLSNAPDVWSDWQKFVKTNTERFQRETENSYELLGFISTATDIAITSASAAAPAFPGGAVLVGLLSGAAGLFLKRPGTDKVIAKEKEDSFNAGAKKAEELAGLIKKMGDPDGTA